jgi:hypothetical protein
MTSGPLSFNDLNEIIEEISSDWYSRLSPAERERKAYFHAAIKYLLFSYDLTDEEIEEEIDERIIDQIENDNNDQGIDFFYVTQDERPKIYVVQVKHHKQFPLGQQKEAVNKMQAEIDLLLSRQKSRGFNEKRKDRFHQLKEVQEKEPQFQFVLLLTGGAEAKLSEDDFAEGLYNEDSCFLKVIDRKGLLTLIESAERPRSVSTTMKIDKQSFVPFHEKGSYKWVSGLVTVKDYVEATRGLGDDLFALNPRLFLSASAGPNKAMISTLENPVERKNFHFYNNGITAVCKKITKKSDEDRFSLVLLEGLRVVNGCQTTETLWKWAKHNAEAAAKTRVMIRIIESDDDEELNRKLSQTTNSQSAILASDLVANDKIQKRLKDALLSSPTSPYFYENRRGEWKKLPQRDRLQLLVSHGEWGENIGKQYRKITLREMAQVLQAVCGLPEQAKEGVATLFKPSNTRYPKLFSESWSHEDQVLLVADLYRFVSRKDNWLKKSASEEENTMAGLGRFYICHLIYETWKGGGRPTFSNDPANVKLIDPENSKIIRDNFVSNVGQLPWLATLSLVRTMENHKSEIESKRALLRISENRSRIQEIFKTVHSIQID